MYFSNAWKGGRFGIGGGGCAFGLEEFFSCMIFFLVGRFGVVRSERRGGRGVYIVYSIL